MTFLYPLYNITKALAIVGDLTVQSDVENLMKRTVENFKQLDILVCYMILLYIHVSTCFATLEFQVHLFWDCTPERYLTFVTMCHF